jgi:hypothetical protein
LRQAAVVAMEPGWESHLRGVLGYAAPNPSSGHVCRHAAMAAHFGDEFPPSCGGMCDLCRRSTQSNADDSSIRNGCEMPGGVAAAETRDVTDAAIAMLRTLAEWKGSEKRATLTQLVDRARSLKASALCIGFL